MHSFTFKRAAISALLGTTMFVPSLALAQSFTDVPAGHPAYDAVEYLKAKGIISGYQDGTFKPDNKVNRAEAAKIIAAPLVTAQELGMVTMSPFSDVPAGAWFLPYVELARVKLGFVDGPPAKTAFKPTSPVLKAEFIKMTLLANKIDPLTSFSEIKLPLSQDVSNTDEWFYPYLRYGVTSSMTMIDGGGNFSPGRELTRGDVSLLLYRFLMYKEGRRTQALLSEAETEIINILSAIDKNDLLNAEYASARALLAARGAHASQPDVALVQSALKISEAFRALVRGYRAGTEGKLEEVIKLSGDAWNLAARAKEISPDLTSISDQVQKISKSMADTARAASAMPAPQQ